MEISIADQIALDDALVAPANRLKIGKCNLRLSSDVTSKEATLQVVYDVSWYSEPVLSLWAALLMKWLNKRIILFWSHSVTTGLTMVPSGAYTVPTGFSSAYGFFCLPCSILFVIAASIIGPQTPLDLEQ
ncbi:hypothetical protein Tco_0133061 [Tanacetum coccineum]